MMNAIMLLISWTALGRAEEIPIPVHALPFPCTDPHFPALLEEYIIGCGVDGNVDRIMSIHDQKVHQLPNDDVWGTGTALFRMGTPGGLWDPTGKQWTGGRIFVDQGTAITQHDTIAVLNENEIVVRRINDKAQYHHPAQGIGWQRPAITQHAVAWIEWTETGEEIALWNWREGEETIFIPAEKPLFLVSDKHRLVWSEPQQIVIYDTQTEQREVIPVQAVRGLTIHERKICWTSWTEEDLDIHCDDGFHLNRKGHQQWPQLHDTGLYFQENGALMWLPN